MKNKYMRHFLREPIRLPEGGTGVVFSAHAHAWHFSVGARFSASLLGNVIFPHKVELIVIGPMLATNMPFNAVIHLEGMVDAESRSSSYPFGMHEVCLGTSSRIKLLWRFIFPAAMSIPPASACSCTTRRCPTCSPKVVLSLHRQVGTLAGLILTPYYLFHSRGETNFEIFM